MVNLKKLEAKLDIEKKKSISRKAQRNINLRGQEIRAEIKKLRGDRLKSLKKSGSSFVAKGGRIATRTGKGLKILTKKATPIIKKQVRLIAEQQRREAALERKISKKKKKKKKSPNKFATRNILDIDF